MHIWGRKKYALTEKSIIELKKDPNIDFKKIRDRNGSIGGGKKWSLWILLLILVQLVNGTTPTSICQNIVSHLALTMLSLEVIFSSY